MSNREEEELNIMKKDYKTVSIPNNIDDFIKKGMNKGKKYKSKKRVRRIVGYAASLLLVVMLITIRISPSFADMMSNIPGIEYIVKLINYDKGLQLAVENEILQHVGVSDEHEDIIFTVEDIIVDEVQMLVFYSIVNNGEYEDIGLKSIKFLNEEGDSLKSGYRYSLVGNKELVEGKAVGKITMAFGSETIIPDELTIKAKLCELISREKGNNADRPNILGGNPERKDFSSTWEVRVPIDKEKFRNLKESYSVNKEIVIDNQKICFKVLTLHPTRVVIDIDYDENNTKKIFGFENLRLIDENTEWEAVSNGVTAIDLSENSVRLYLESSYFTKPKSIYIEADGIRALDKDKLNIKIDLENELLLNSPDNKLKFVGVEYFNDQKDLVFDVFTQDDTDSRVSFNWNFKDGNGEEFECEGIGVRIMEGRNKEFVYSIPNKDYVSPITLNIQEYPSVIKKDIKIRVK